jgi:hypothetical protein
MALQLKKVKKNPSRSNMAYGLNWKVEKLCQEESLIGDCLSKLETFIKYYPKTNAYSMENLYYVKLVEETTSLQIYRRSMQSNKKDLLLYEISK